MLLADNSILKTWVFIIAGASLSLFVTGSLNKTEAAESSCIICHLNKEMLKNNITAATGKKSALQSGAG